MNIVYDRVSRYMCMFVNHIQLLRKQVSPSFRTQEMGLRCTPFCECQLTSIFRSTLDGSGALRNEESRGKAREGLILFDGR